MRAGRPAHMALSSEGGNVGRSRPHTRSHMAKTRKIGPEGMGSGGDLNDRLRNAYSPGANANIDTSTGLKNPVTVIKQMLKKKPKKAKPSASGWTGTD